MKKVSGFAIIIMAIILLNSCDTIILLNSCDTMNSKNEKLTYPKATKDTVVDNYFGTKVADPYRWLEDDNSEATAQWVNAENKVTQDYLSKITFRDAMKKRLEKLWNYPKSGLPFKKGDFIFYFPY